VKSLTGNDSVNARVIYGRPFTFIPSAKFFLRVNDKPQIRDESHGMWRRIKLVPFLETFAIDAKLSAELATEAPGILNWAIQGCLDWQRDGLSEPAIVKAATAEYRGEQDQFASFIESCCELVEGISVRASHLYDAYKTWAADNTRLEDRLSQTAFGKRMKARVAFNDQGRHTIYYGIALSQEEVRRAA
jgi:putative DNA primase/helicase